MGLPTEVAGCWRCAFILILSNYSVNVFSFIVSSSDTSSPFKSCIHHGDGVQVPRPASPEYALPLTIDKREETDVFKCQADYTTSCCSRRKLVGRSLELETLNQQILINKLFYSTAPSTPRRRHDLYGLIKLSFTGNYFTMGFLWVSKNAKTKLASRWL